MIKYPQIIPWYMFILDINYLIISPNIPNEISDSKKIIYAETSIPGLSYSPVSSGGFGNRKINFTLKLINRKTPDGNTSILKLYELLRNPTSNIVDVFSQSSQFKQNPKVLYNYGIGSVPLVWYVTKCDFNHFGQYSTAIGNSKISDISIELTLDETNITNKIEEVFRQFSALIGIERSAEQFIRGQFGERTF